MMSSHIKLISSLAVLASSVAIVSPLELGASATLPIHLATSAEATEQTNQSTPRRVPAHSPLAEIAAEVRGWESTEREATSGAFESVGEGQSEQDTQEMEGLDNSFREYVFNKYGSFFFGSEEG